MKISLLLEREPFVEILEKTLASFLNGYYQKPYHVKWYSGCSKISTIIKRGEQPWLCNPDLNAIFTIGADSKVFNPVKSEFSTHPNPWRSPAQRIYVRVATAKPFRKWFCPAAIGISPPVPDAENILIIGGNHKIRVINHRTKTVYAILKQGFDKAYISRELEIRQEYDNLPIPAVQEVSTDGTWFSERYVNGTPINRLRDKELAASVVGQVAKSLCLLLTATAREERVRDYADSLGAQVKADIKKNHLLKADDKRLLRAKVDELLKLIDQFARFVDGVIITAQTHGDFQAANILCDNGHAWLIDWEYTARRQIGYDALVFLLDSRFPKGLAERIESSVKNNGVRHQSLLGTWPDFEWKDKQRCRMLAMIFLLEELHLLMAENRNSYLQKPSAALLEFQIELGIALRTLGRK